MTDKLLKGEIKPDNKDIIQPQHPYRMCICGSSGSGKTKFCMSLLLEKNQPFDKIIWIAPEYSLKQVKMKNFIDMIGKHISVFSDINKDQEEIEKLIEDYYNKGFQTCIVFDDMMTEKKNKFVSDMFIGGRHKNCSVIELTQSIFGVNRLHRLNTNYHCLYRFGDALECKMLCRMINPNHANELLDLYEDATSKKYGCFIIDSKWHELDDENRKLLRYRDTKFNNVYNVDF